MSDNQESLNIKVKLFAIYQEVYQQEEIIINLPFQSQVKEVLTYIIKQKPHLKDWAKITKIAVNLDFVSPDYYLNDNDEVALIPPVSGG